MRSFYKIVLLVITAIPLVVYGQDATSVTVAKESSKFSNFKEFIGFLVDLLNPLTVIVASMSLLVFFWGLAKFILVSGDEKALDEGKQLMFWGVIALFVMVSIWGIVNLLSGDIFGVSVGIPQL
jgi:hypothetical protein